MERIYSVDVKWTGNNGTGTSRYDAYGRNHIIQGKDKPAIMGSAEELFRGDESRYNPEELLVSALSTCHMLWYLHLCADAGVIVLSYKDSPVGKMFIPDTGSGHFTEVTLNPIVRVAEESMISPAMELHEAARNRCFIANSVNFKVNHLPEAKCTE
jgi:organic hydroperoxide reductase OsmC/OhrA